MKNKKLKMGLAAISIAAVAGYCVNGYAQSVDSLLDKLVDKGVITVTEAKELREESDKDFTKAYSAKNGMPEWVDSYKFGGDFRGRYEQFNTPDNANSTDRIRYRYRLRVGVVAALQENMEVGFRLTSGESGRGFSTGSPVSGNTTMSDNGTKKGVYIDAAYAKWTAINNGEWMVAGTVGKMDNPFTFTDMLFDTDYTPEGAAITGGFSFNEKHSLAFTAAAFALDELAGSTQDPYVCGGQILLNSTWSSKLASTVGVGVLQIANAPQLTTNNVPYVNQGSTRTPTGVLRYDYNPIIADANVTYKLDSFPLYTGEFPIKLGSEYIYNPALDENNSGYWAGITFGKSGKKHNWDLNYRYLYLESDAWYDQVVSDENSVFYQGAPSGGLGGTYSGTNIKGHMVKLNYSLTDFAMFSLTGFLTELVDSTVYNNVNEPNSKTLHVQADVSVKF